MSRSRWLATRLLITLAAVVSLSFAATEVFAATKTCENNGGFPWLGECASEKECTVNCRAVHGPTATGACVGPSGGCCQCQW